MIILRDKRVKHEFASVSAIAGQAEWGDTKTPWHFLSRPEKCLAKKGRAIIM
ncbi:hypothetical protein ALO41_101905 [Pseudomonas amygdali pv. ulmi]|uniref:Uncharacterized protein n=1 Tax=Pseudomonas amygdali pv. ulmi TaxID=251720 RepID=A0A0Q0DG50_PSEA0|nr:hypothetical protein ALO41_101905 [Pseudomonas amygdali pv. ulmi]